MRRALGAGLAFFASTLAVPARAHGFGQRYDLPIPLSLYLAGAALTVAVSCVMLALFVRATFDHPAAQAGNEARGRRPGFKAGIVVLRAIAVALYVLVVLAGFFGNQSPVKNVAPVMVWAVWWVGMAYVSALLGDLWKLVNPLDTLYRLGESILPRRASRAPRLVLPEAVGVWPSVALFVVWLWMEIAWESSDRPASVAGVILAYSILTWLGMYAFGRRQWLESGEVFSRVFGVIARFAPIDLRDTDDGGFEWRLRPYGAGLLARDPASPSETALVILILAAVSFDGFLETPAWAAIVERFAAGGDATAARTAGLAAAPLAFFAMYAFFCGLIARAGGARAASRRILGLFVLTLVPIAIAYQIAHYLSFLVMAGQYLIPLASDPLGLGWNLFGTAHYFVRPGLVDARLIWYLSLTAIVAGHVAALYLSHLLSLQEFPERGAAVRSQWPMLALMVGYTMLSLWIIAQPIVTSR